MAYIGKQPIVGNYQVLDALTATTTATYALTKNSVAVFPQTPANCIVSLNGVIQAPFDSYTISGSNIVFASALTGTDSIDFITVLGDVLNVGTVSDGTIGISKLSATGTPSSSTFLRGDNSWVSAGGANTPAFLAYLSADQTVSDATETKVQVNTEIFDTNSCYDNATNYRFTPTTAGKYFVFGNLIGSVAAISRLSQIAISFRKNGTNVVESNDDKRSAGYGLGAAIYMSCVLDFNGTTDYVEMFGYVNDDGGSNVDFGGNATKQRTIFGAYKIIE